MNLSKVFLLKHVFTLYTRTSYLSLSSEIQSKWSFKNETAFTETFMSIYINASKNFVNFVFGRSHLCCHFVNTESSMTGKLLISFSDSSPLVRIMQLCDDQHIKKWLSCHGKWCGAASPRLVTTEGIAKLYHVRMRLWSQWQFYVSTIWDLTLSSKIDPGLGPNRARVFTDYLQNVAVTCQQPRLQSNSTIVGSTWMCFKC